jgi:hypothetical protein
MYPHRLVETALLLSAAGVLDRENAQICRVSVQAIRHWRAGRRRNEAPGGKPAAGRCPRCNQIPLDAPAYAYLLGLYLGDGYITRGRRDVFALSIACSDGWPGLKDAAEAALSAVMPTSSVFRVQRPGCTEVKSTSKHWPCLFPQHGPGKKHNRKIELEPWQQMIASQDPGALVRGLFHSDGCRFTNRVRRPLTGGDRWYEYPRYMFTNESRDILEICGSALDQLGVDWRFSRRNTISVARKDAVARLDEFVGPKY